MPRKAFQQPNRTEHEKDTVWRSGCVHDDTEKGPTLTADPANEHGTPGVRVQTRWTCARICKFPEPKGRTRSFEVTTAPDGWWPIPASKSKLVFLFYPGVRAIILFFKLMRVQSAKTHAYVLGRIVIAA